MTTPAPARTVCIQGLGFVGAAMAAAVASARDANGAPLYRVTGVDLDAPLGRQRIEAINEGRFPFETSDPKLEAAIRAGRESGNLSATSDPAAYSEADVIVVDVHLDVQGGIDDPSLDLSGFEAAIRTVAERAKPGALILVETTVPPGTCERVVAPILDEATAARGLGQDALMLAHSYERVMPGADYLDSIVNYWRVYSGRTEAAAQACERFLSSIVNVADYPLTRLGSMTASETAKVLENSYRATNIAFIEEWGRFAERVGIDLFEVVEAIRMRPTHSNIRQPGFGVGGYCLTKDPLFAYLAAQRLFGAAPGELPFEFSRRALAVNAAMPRVSLDRLDAMLGGLDGRRVLLMGATYRQDVADTRYSPSMTFLNAAREAGADVTVSDPLMRAWEETGEGIEGEPERAARKVDAIVFAVPHRAYRDIVPAEWLGEGPRPAILDANAVLSAAQRQGFEALGCRVASIGRGDA